mmetsp:Transcript_32381/g.103251  ORF Transcript_32381/g.103251 Transcript_32381/m.103251 type:complete len:203 (-) Transcript_32381:409-1017(-)
MRGGAGEGLVSDADEPGVEDEGGGDFEAVGGEGDGVGHLAAAVVPEVLRREEVVVGGDGPEGLVVDAVFEAEGAEVGVVVGLGVEAVLEDFGLDPRGVVEPPEEGEVVAVGDADLGDEAVVDGLFEAVPDGHRVLEGPEGRVQKEGIDAAEVAQRRLQTLRDLVLQRRRDVVGHLRPLAAEGRELRLDPDVAPRHVVALLED